MITYEIKDVVCDYGLYEDGELKLILNSRANAELIKRILEIDVSVPNVATRANMLELPCNIGDTVYKVAADGAVVSFKVTGFEIRGDGARPGKYLSVRSLYGSTIGRISFDSIGKTAFFDRDKALEVKKNRQK